jgi:hypothetical protein
MLLEWFSGEDRKYMVAVLCFVLMFPILHNNAYGVAWLSAGGLLVARYAEPFIWLLGWWVHPGGATVLVCQQFGRAAAAVSQLLQDLGPVLTGRQDMARKVLLRVWEQACDAALSKEALVDCGVEGVVEALEREQLLAAVMAELAVAGDS